jgi:hypothetical protein
MSKDSSPPVTEAVRRWYSELGKKGGHAGKGSPAVIAKMHRATEIRLGRTLTFGASDSAFSEHPIYEAWYNMKRRCYSPKANNFKYWGGRGIKVCDRWLESFENFRDDMFSTWVKGLVLDRINNEGDYEPGNCKWSTRKESARNRRSGKTKTLSEM